MPSGFNNRAELLQTCDQLNQFIQVFSQFKGIELFEMTLQYLLKENLDLLQKNQKNIDMVTKALPRFGAAHIESKRVLQKELDEAKALQMKVQKNNDELNEQLNGLLRLTQGENKAVTVQLFELLHVIRKVAVLVVKLIENFACIATSGSPQDEALSVIPLIFGPIIEVMSAHKNLSEIDRLLIFVNYTPPKDDVIKALLDNAFIEDKVRGDVCLKFYQKINQEFIPAFLMHSIQFLNFFATAPLQCDPSDRAVISEWVRTRVDFTKVEQYTNMVRQILNLEASPSVQAAQEPSPARANAS